jgi:hypothetical protein
MSICRLQPVYADSILKAHRLKATLIDRCDRRLISFDEARRFFAIV